MIYTEGAIPSNMSKTKVKLDAICAKLKMGLAQPEDTSLTRQEVPVADPAEPARDLSESKMECDDASRVGKGQDGAPNGEVNGLDPDEGTMDSIPSSRASTPPTQCNNNNPTRTLTGASRRKSRKKVSRIDQTDSAAPRGDQEVDRVNNGDNSYLSHDNDDDNNDCEDHNSKASIYDYTQGEYPSMHVSNGYGEGATPSPSPPAAEEVPQDLSINKTVIKGTDCDSARYRRDSYDPLAIADFAERSYGQEEESDLLINEEQDREDKGSSEANISEDARSVDTVGIEKPVREMPLRIRTEESYPTEPEDLSMPKGGRKTDGEGRGEEGGAVASPSHSSPRDNGRAEVPTNSSKGGVLYDTAAVREYAADTMKEFLGMYGYEDEQQRAERDDVRLDNFAFGQLTQENLKAHGRRPVDAFRARLEQEIRANPPKVEAGQPYDELQPQFMHMKLQRRTSSGKRKLGLHNGSQTFVKKMNQHIKGEKACLSEEEQDRSNRFSKYDYFIQKMEAGESISHDIPNARISKYDSYIHRLNQGNSIQKVIGKRETMELTKPPREISPRPRQKHSSSPLGSHGNTLGQGAPRAHSGGLEFHPPPMVTLAQSIFAGGAPYPILASMPGMPPIPAMMAGPLGALNLSGTIDLGMSPQSGALPGPRPASVGDSKGGSGSEPSQSGLFKRSLLSGAGAEMEAADSPNEPVKGFSKYIARYAANENCSHCGFHYKEHFHCMEEECSFARFTRKEDVMRHYNWHRRRDDSLQHGFMRFSPSDDCSPHYPGCGLNFRNTHYHCMQGCNKVYTSTSDVLGHENFHKKNATLLNEGFQRYRATEDCGTPSCEFYGQKTTHFHCQRHGCNFVFKNKYDIERHKTFHTKDDIYKREGFKKFSKHESCNYESCPYSHMLNHFHCLRPGCNFVFTTANQMHSHKRKHERLERIIRYDHSHLDDHSSGGGLIMDPRATMHPGSLPGTSGVTHHPLSLVKSEASILQNVLQASPMVVLKPGIPYQALNLAMAAGQIPMVNTSMGPLPLMPPPPSLMGEGLIKSEPSSPEMSRPPPPYKERDSQYQGRKSPYTGREALYKGRDSPSYRERGSPSERKLPEGFSKIEAKVSRSTEGEELNDSLNLPIPSEISPPYGEDEERTSDEERSTDESSKQDEAWRRYLQRYTANDPCNSRCELLYKDHYHCMVDNCGQVFKSKENVKKHTRYHLMSEESSKLGFQFFPHGQSCEGKFKNCVFSPLAHYHCMWVDAGKISQFLPQIVSVKCRHEPVLLQGPLFQSLRPESFCGEVIHTGSALMRPHFEKHMSNPNLARIHDLPEDARDRQSPLSERRSPLIERRSPGIDQRSPVVERRSPVSEPPTTSSPPVATIRPHTVSSHTPPPSLQLSREGPSKDDPSKDESREGLSTDATPSDDLSPREAPPKTGPPNDIQMRELSSPRETYPGGIPLKAPPPLRDLGYESMEASKCPRENCPLAKMVHYHCTKAECQYATENQELMLDHKTNEKIIFESFKQCSRKQDCRRPACKYNLLHKHFHCMHQGCHFSFLQVQQMESHGRKHMRRIYGKLFNRPNSNNPGSGQQFVLPIMNLSRSESPPMMGSPSMVSPVPPFYQSLISSGLIQGMSAIPPGSTTISWSAIPQPTLVNATGITPHTSLHNHQQLLLPITSIPGQTLSTDTPSPSNAYGRYGEASSPPSAASPGRSYSPRKRPLTLVIEDPGAPSGYKRYKRGPLDSSMQEKFQRFERSEHCRDPNCQYTLNTTHYHCLHEGCDYRFAGKTMMYKHSQHHERVDSIVQDDFQRYKSTANCKRGDCEYGSKNTHFHCLRCPFICTDSGKVGVHRKQHSVSLVAERNGFKPFSSGEACPHSDCKYDRKYTHYHCERCHQAVMGMQQMDMHMKNHQLDAATPSTLAQTVA